MVLNGSIRARSSNRYVDFHFLDSVGFKGYRGFGGLRGFGLRASGGVGGNVIRQIACPKSEPRKTLLHRKARSHACFGGEKLLPTVLLRFPNCGPSIKQTGRVSKALQNVIETFASDHS